jgi:hypothetical protein
MRLAPSALTTEQTIESHGTVEALDVEVLSKTIRSAWAVRFSEQGGRKGRRDPRTDPSDLLSPACCCGAPLTVRTHALRLLLARSIPRESQSISQCLFNAG